ncbi:MAG: hypothetical protein EXR62_00910 [Chloroflexi bacterium]|nr:hypothetical protein [Chloroflexota bacterium]
MELVAGACRYPPVGIRGLSAARGHNEYRSAPIKEFTQHANNNVMLIAQIELEEAVENIDNLMATPGLDVALIGPNDLAVSLGASSNTDPKVTAAIERVIEAGKRHNIPTGIHLRDLAPVQEWGRKGMQMLTCGSDVGFLTDGASAVVRGLKG